MPRIFKSIDPILFWTLVFLVVGGIFIFLSASLALYDEGKTQFSDVAISQIVLGLGGGIIAFLIGLTVPYRFWRKFALIIFLSALALTAAVFIPGIGLKVNGATRWLDAGVTTVQPAEFLKIAYIMAIAAWYSNAKSKIGTIRYGLLPYAAITGLIAVVLLLQPDTDTFIITAIAGGAMYFAAGARWRDIGVIILTAIICLSALLLLPSREYLGHRLTTFLNPESDPQGKSYQVQQSLKAIGAGEIFGRGYGKSIQKFGKLPEPTSDSIFSVFAEEFGFVGSVILVSAFLLFALRGLWVAARAPDVYGALLATGIVVLITSESFLNIGAMLSLVPLSGLPLVFISHGGTALLTSLGAAGILMSISRAVKA
jgi:cell division protein FtsW